MGTSDGQVIGLKKIIDHGGNDSRWNLVILSEGYLATELPQFESDAQHFVDMLQQTQPFDELWCGINVHLVKVSSTESGADDEACLAAPKSTFFDAKFCSGDNPVLLTVNDQTARDVAYAQVPETDQVVVIVNSQTYGGSGSSGMTMVFSLGRDSAGNDAALTGIHELGHAAFGLADEYGGNPTTKYASGELSQPNVSMYGSMPTCKWSSMVTAPLMPTVENVACGPAPAVPAAVANMVGAFEGGYYYDCGVYRPKADCKMRSLAAPFCEVCQMQIRKILAPYTITVNASTASLSFTNTAGSVPTAQPIVFGVTSCSQALTSTPVTLRLSAGPTAGFTAIDSSDVTVSPDTSPGQFWISYDLTTDGDRADGSVEVEWVEIGQKWQIDLHGTTVAAA